MSTKKIVSGKIVLYLMSEKGYEVLNAIIFSGNINQIAAVIGAKDLNVEKDYYEEIKQLAIEHRIDFFEKNIIPEIVFDYCIAISWRWIIKDNKNLIVLHDSILPRYRGFAPLVNALINFEPKIGVTALFASEEYDTGRVIGQEFTFISYPIRIAEAIKKVSILYQNLIISILNNIKNNTLGEGEIQNEADATYSLWRDEDDYEINWSESAEKIRQFIYSVSYPYKGASTKLKNGELIRILDVTVEPDVVIENRIPGKVIFIKEGLPVIVCGSGLVKIIEAKFEDGSNALPFKSFRTRLI